MIISKTPTSFLESHYYLREDSYTVIEGKPKILVREKGSTYANEFKEQMIPFLKVIPKLQRDTSMQKIKSELNNERSIYR